LIPPGGLIGKDGRGGKRAITERLAQKGRELTCVAEGVANKVLAK